jgi:hypothetical protein
MGKQRPTYPTMKTIAITTLLLTATLAAQGQVLTFTIPGGQTTTGAAAGGGPGQIGVAIGGHGTIPVGVPPGTGSAGVATALAGALASRGFNVQQNGDAVTVLQGPGGTPLRQGGGIGSTDTGVVSVRARVEPNAPPGLKANGVAVPKAQPGQVAAQNGQVQVDAEVMRRENGQWVPAHVQVVVPVQQGDTAEQVNQRARQALEAQGFRVTDVEVPKVLAPREIIGAFQLDRTADSSRVQDVRLTVSPGLSFFGGSSLRVASSVTIGAADFGEGFVDLPTVRVPYLWWTGPDLSLGGTLNGQFPGPGLPGVLFVSPYPTFPPLPLPFFGPDAFLFIDPLAMLSLPMTTGPLGGFQLPIPPLTGGLDLAWQAVVVTPTGVVGTPGLQTVGR